MYWEGKCFPCIFWGTLALIIGLSAPPIYKDIKNNKNKHKTEQTHITYKDGMELIEVALFNKVFMFIKY